MNRSKNFNSLFIFVIVLLVAVVVLEYGRGLVNNPAPAYNRSSLERDIEADKITYVVITPNSETPTGQVRVSFNDGSEDVSFYSTDVVDIE